MFILFDFVVHNPSHPETNTNLALLDVAAGHFSKLEYASDGSVPGSLFSEFARIARQFDQDGRSNNTAQSVSVQGAEETLDVSTSLDVDAIAMRSSELLSTADDVSYTRYI
jgi:hypothetical protein